MAGLAHVQFSRPDMPNKFGLEPARANFIQPRKRPLSSMSPTIVTTESGQLLLVGAAAARGRAAPLAGAGRQAPAWYCLAGL